MLSVIVPAYKEAKTIEQCLRSIKNQTFENFEIIVVAGGDKRTIEIAKRYGAVVEDEECIGAGHARNEGVKKAKGDVLVFTDADGVVPRDWLEKYARVFENTDIVACGGPIRPLKGTMKDRVIYKINQDWLYRTTALFGFYQLSGANCAYRRKTFQKVGGFREDMSMMEDTELANRIKREGRVGFDPTNPVYSLPRRMRENGYLSVGVTYLKEYFRFYFLGENPDEAYFLSMREKLLKKRKR